MRLTLSSGLVALLAVGLSATGCGGGEPDQIEVQAYAVQGADSRQLLLFFPWNGMASARASSRLT